MKSIGTLRREQRNIDSYLSRQSLGAVKTPAKGWVRTIREALGMTADQLGARIEARDGTKGISGNSVRVMERNEATGGVSLGTLRRVADALDCDVAYALIPRSALRTTFDRQIDTKTDEILASTAATMSLEGQHPEEALDVRSEMARELVKGGALWN